MGGPNEHAGGAYDSLAGDASGSWVRAELLSRIEDASPGSSSPMLLHRPRHGGRHGAVDATVEGEGQVFVFSLQANR
jgi:hypothetical protein